MVFFTFIVQILCRFIDTTITYTCSSHCVSMFVDGQRIISTPVVGYQEELSVYHQKRWSLIYYGKFEIFGLLFWAMWNDGRSYEKDLLFENEFVFQSGSLIFFNNSSMFVLSYVHYQFKNELLEFTPDVVLKNFHSRYGR